MDGLMRRSRSHAERVHRIASALIDAKSEQFRPFEDPLRLNVRDFRWLRLDGELAYSDWLAWVFREVADSSASLALRLIGANDWSASAERDAQLSVEREVPVPHGHVGRGGRIDILLTLRQEAIPYKRVLIVEVKTTTKDNSDLEKNLGYVQSLRDRVKKDEDLKCIVVTTDEVSEDGFISWIALCQGMRNAVPDLLQNKGTNLCGAMLLFCSAVEQKLLGLTPIGRSDRFISPSPAIARTTRYLDGRSIDETEVEMDTETIEIARKELVPGLMAIRDARNAIVRAAQAVVQSKTEALAISLRLPATALPISEWLNPKDPNDHNWDGTFAWVAARLRSGTLDGYFGLYWGGPRPRRPDDVRVIAMFAVDRRSAPRRLITICKESIPQELLEGVEVEEYEPGEVSLSRKFDPDGAPSFKQLLGELIDGWIVTFKTNEVAARIVKRNSTAI
jgi:hypothetical protein